MLLFCKLLLAQTMVLDVFFNVVEYDHGMLFMNLRARGKGVSQQQIQLD